MTRRATPLFWVALLLAIQSIPSRGTAQGAPDVPPGPGTIHGRIVHQEDPGRSVGGIPVVLYALQPSGLPGIRQGVSDREGRFRFEGLSNQPTTPYLIGAEYQGVPYSGARAVFPPGELEVEVEIRVAEVTSDAQQLSVPLARLRIEWLGARLRVVESLTIRNASAHTVYIPEEARGTLPAALRAPLPAGAEEFLMPHGLQPEGVLHRDGEVFFWGPVYPGEQELTFSYVLPAGEETVRFDAAFPNGAEKIEILTSAAGPTPSGVGLVEGEPKELEGQRFRIFERPALAPGQHLTLSLELPEARVDPDALEVTEVRLLLSHDDAALEVRETHLFSVGGSAGVKAAPGEPLLRIYLPEESQDLRLASGFDGLKLEKLPDGGLGVGGVAPPGESAVRFDYRIPVRGSSVDLVRSFEARVPLLALYLADTGRLIPESDRLHRRRPMRTDDLTYIHLEAFSVAPGEEVALRITTRPPSRAHSSAAVTAFVLLGGALCAALLIAPLLGRGVGPEASAAEELPGQRERESIYTAIRDLEHDYETGKIAEADYTGMREELRARAVALIRRERESAAEAEESSASPLCPFCGAEVRAADRFCSQCGGELSASGQGEGKR